MAIDLQRSGGVASARPGTERTSRRSFLKTGLLGGLGAIAAPYLGFGRARAAEGSPVEVSTRAVDLVRGSTVVDMLGLLTLDWPRLRRWQAEPESFAENEYRDLERSGVDIFHPAIETGSRNPRASALRWLAAWDRLLAGPACFLSRVGTIDDLLRVPRRGPIGIVVGFQDSDHFAATGDVELFHALGQRVGQLTYNGRNRLGSGCYERLDHGLTPFGGEVVAEMNRVGMAVDLSHCGERTTLGAIEASRVPVLVTHSNCAALVSTQPRCKSDAVIRALAAAGGVMGISVVRSFVGGPHATIEDLLDHFAHVARLVGVEHVGLGSDTDVDTIDPATGLPRPFYAIRGLDPVARVYQIADGLLRRGFSVADVELVLGGNFLRVLAAIWPASSWSVAAERELRRDPFCPAPAY